MRKKRKPARKKAGIPPEFRDVRGKFLPGNPGGPGRLPLPLELENLRAIASVITPEAWRELAQEKLKDAKKGVMGAFEWIERRTLGEATLQELRKAEGEAVAPEALEKAALLELNEAVLREELLRCLRKARVGQLSPEESERVLEIRRVLNEVQTVEKLPDFSDRDPAEAEEELFRLKEAAAQEPHGAKK